MQAELLGALARVGIEPDSPKGEPFDPHRHEAIAQQPVEGAEPGTIVEVYRPATARRRRAAAGQGRRGGLGGAVAQRDLYKVLGVDKKASPDEIKKAYRKLARQYHPDRNPGDKQAEERFKEISAAYDILGDPDKRKQYDRGGMFGRRGPGGGGAGGFGGFDAGRFGDILSNLFGGGGAGGGGPAAPARRAGRAPSAAATSRPRSRSPSTRRSTGAQVPLAVPTSQRCATCHGTGAKPGTAPKVCPRCQGRGIESAGPGPVLDLPAVLALRRRRAPSSRTRARPATARAPCARSRSTA